MPKRILAPILASLFATTVAHAFGPTGHSLYGHVGMLQDNFARVSTSDTGSTGLFSGPMPAIGIKWRLGPIMPGVTYTVLGHSAESGTSKTRVLAFEVPYLWDFALVEVKTGVAMVLTTVSGSGDIVQLNNGTGTSSFATPGRSSTSTVAAIHLGAAMTLTNPWRIDLDGWISDAFSSRRAITLFLSVGYGFM
jgi:hypothetical protein